MSTKATAAAYKGPIKPIWCPGCGDFGALAATQRTLAELEVDPEKLVIVSGIGCSGRFPDFVHSYGFHGCHGRVLPTALGVKTANPELTVLGVSGDGDAFAIGGGHFPHACRRNVDMTYLVLDNEIYGLTKGQPSPSSPLLLKTKASPYGVAETPLNPMAIALVNGVCFAARVNTSNPKLVGEVMAAAVKHRGFSFVQCLSPCVTFFRDTMEMWKEQCAPLPEGWDPTDLPAAVNLVLTESLPHVGIFYQVERPTLEDLLEETREKAVARSNGGFDRLLDAYR